MEVWSQLPPSWIAKKIKKQIYMQTLACPRCEVMIEKNGGCQSVTCTACVIISSAAGCRQSHAGHSHKNSLPVWCRLCAPGSFLRNKHPYWGPGLIRPVTKTVAVVTVATLPGSSSSCDRYHLRSCCSCCIISDMVSTQTVSSQF